MAAGKVPDCRLETEDDVASVAVRIDIAAAAADDGRLNRAACLIVAR